MIEARFCHLNDAFTVSQFHAANYFGLKLKVTREASAT
jgi:hypothetical protein